MTIPRISDEMREAVAARPDTPIVVQDEETKALYVLVSKDAYLELQEECIRRELQISFDQADRGEISDLDMHAILAEAHRRHAERQFGNQVIEQSVDNDMDAIYEILDRRYSTGETDLADRHNEHHP